MIFTIIRKWGSFLQFVISLVSLFKVLTQKNIVSWFDQICSQGDGLLLSRCLLIPNFLYFPSGSKIIYSLVI